MNERERVAILIFDKMSLEPHLDVDINRENIDGFVEMGGKRLEVWIIKDN